MIEYFTVSIEEGKEQALKMAHILEKKGYEILDIEKGLVPRGENAEGMLYYAPGYKISVDNGKPPRYRGKWFSELPVTIGNSSDQFSESHLADGQTDNRTDGIFADTNQDNSNLVDLPVAVNENLVDPPGVKSDSRWLWE